MVAEGANLLEVKNLSIKFGGLTAVNSFNLTLRGGELFGLIGPNGAGKTTVFNMLTGFYRPTSGEIRFCGKDLVGLPPYRFAEAGISRTFQNIRLFGSLSSLENVRTAEHLRVSYGLWPALVRSRGVKEEEERITDEAMQLLKRLGLEKVAYTQAKNLPYGQQRRLEIARALATRPKLLLLDEPAAGMNPEEVDELADLIRRIREEFNVTIFLIEHHMRLVMGICERIKVLDFGETIAEGSPIEVKSDPRVIEAYLGKGGNT